MKRGQNLSIGTVGLIALTLIVVVILALLFRQIVTGGGRQLQNMTEGAEIKPNVCTNTYLGRFCKQSCPDGTRTVPGYWTDCEKMGEGVLCCEQT